jgi:hypothetical protein
MGTLSGQIYYCLHASLCAVIVCGPRVKSGLLLLLLALDLSLLEQKDEADIFYLYIGIYTFNPRPPVLRVGCVLLTGEDGGETLPVSKNLSTFELLILNRFTSAPSF